MGNRKMKCLYCDNEGVIDSPMHDGYYYCSNCDHEIDKKIKRIERRK